MGIFTIYPKLAYSNGSSDGEESACNVGDLGLIPGLGRYHIPRRSPIQVLTRPDAA